VGIIALIVKSYEVYKDKTNMEGIHIGGDIDNYKFRNKLCHFGKACWKEE
jgi:thioredoxin reductase